MPRRFIAVSIGVLGIALAVIVTPAGTPLFSVGKPAIRIGVNAWPPCEVWYIAAERGYFESVDVELVRFSSWGDNMRAMYDEKTDITHATYFNAAYFADKGADGTIIQVIDTIEGGDGFVVRAHEGNPLPFQGLRVGVEINTDEHFLLEQALRDFGMTLEEVQPVSLTAGEGIDAYLSGEVDALFTYSPFLETAIAQGGELVWSTRELPGYMIDVLVARTEVLDEREAALATVLRAWHRSLAYIRENPEDAYATMAAVSGADPATYGPFFESFTFFSPEDNAEILRPEVLGARLEEMMAFLAERGGTTYTGTVSRLYTARFTP